MSPVVRVAKIRVSGRAMNLTAARGIESLAALGVAVACDDIAAPPVVWFNRTQRYGLRVTVPGGTVTCQEDNEKYFARSGGGAGDGRVGHIQGGEVRQQEVERGAQGGDPRGCPLGARRARLPGSEHAGNRRACSGLQGDALLLVREQEGAVRGVGRVASRACRRRDRAEPRARLRRSLGSPARLRAGAAAPAARRSRRGDKPGCYLRGYLRSNVRSDPRYSGERQHRSEAGALPRRRAGTGAPRFRRGGGGDRYPHWVGHRRPTGA